MILSVVIITWLGSSMMNVYEAKKRTGTIILSPNKSKSIEYINSRGQSILQFYYHKYVIVTSEVIASGEFNKSDLKITWPEETTIILESPNAANFEYRKDETFAFGETINILYSGASIDK